MVENGMVGLGFGAYFGMVFFGKHMKPEILSHVDMKDQGWWRPIARLAIVLLLCGIVGLPYLLLSKKAISNIYVLMTFKTLLPSFAAGFLLYCGLFEKIFLRYNLLKLDQEKVEMSESEKANWK